MWVFCFTLLFPLSGAKELRRQSYHGLLLDMPTKMQADEEKVCPLCNTPLKKIGEEFVRRELVFIPAKLACD